jgi:hypothetical protein
LKVDFFVEIVIDVQRGCVAERLSIGVDRRRQRLGQLEAVREIPPRQCTWLMTTPPALRMKSR